MIKSNTLIPTYSITTGQYCTVKVGFVSDTMLTGKVLRFNPGIYSPTATSAEGVAFQIKYPAATGQYEFQKLNCKNHKSFVKIIDAYNFIVEFRFFASKNIGGWIPDVAHLNASAFETSTLSASLAFLVRVGLESATAFVPIELSEFCDSPLYFDVTGYIPGKDMEIQITGNGTISNNFYIGLIKSDAISNAVDIVPGLVMNYANIGNGVVQIYDLPFEAVKSGLGFIKQGTNSKASITIDGTYLQEGSTYKVYAVFFEKGWKSCISKEITQKAIKEPIIPIVTYTIEDAFGNAAEVSCAKGLSNMVPVDLCLTIDTADFTTKINEAGYTGSFDDYFANIRAFYGGGVSASTGVPLSIVSDGSTFCVNGFLTDKKSAFVVFQVTMMYLEYYDILNFVFELEYSAPELAAEIMVNDGSSSPVVELCSGGEYMIIEDFADCKIYESIDGGDYHESTLINGHELDAEQIAIGSNVCLKVVCDNTTSILDSCPCPVLMVSKGYNYAGFGPTFTSFWFGDGATWNATVEPAGILTQFIPLLQGNEEEYFEVDVSISGIITNITIEILKGDCKYTFPNAHLFILPLAVQYIPLIAECIGIPTEDTECKNYAALVYECDEDTQTVTLSIETNYESATETEDFMCSTDGGLTFIPCPSAIVGTSSIFVTYDATFTDGCEAIHLEQVIECLKYTEYANSREMGIENLNGILKITFDDNFNSVPLSDFLYVSKNAGVDFVEYDLLGLGYTPEIILQGDEDIVAYSITQFEDGFVDLVINKSLKISKVITNNEPCDGYDSYVLNVSYDENTGVFVANTTGDQEDLEVNELLWTLGGGNPFDNNGTGVPYALPVEGEGLFIARWKIKISGCDPIILDGFAFGKSCVTFCPDTTINVNLPEQPIKMCIVECCDEVFTIECVDHVLTVAGDLTDATISWTGPGGFTATGNDITVDENGIYYANIAKPGCSATVSYLFNHAEAGTPIDEEIDV